MNVEPDLAKPDVAAVLSRDDVDRPRVIDLSVWLEQVYGRPAAQEVAAYLMLVGDRERHVAALAGEPQLVETEALSQSFAGAFHREIFASVQMLAADALVTLLQPLRPPHDVRSFTKRLRDSSEVIALRTGRTYVYPAFQISAKEHRVRPPVAQANRRLLASRDPWGALSWWVTENPRWGHRRPMDFPDEPELAALVGADADAGF